MTIVVIVVFAVEMVDARFSWNDAPVVCQLSDINMHIRRGQLVAIVGSVGAGKSTLLAAIAGELNSRSGICRVRSNKMAYVTQEAWIQNKTLKGNIVFDTHFDPIYYDRVLDACALRDDLALLPRGDATEIGEKVCCLLVAQS